MLHVRSSPRARVDASTVRDPVTKSSIAKLESVQRRAARFCCSDYRRTSSVTSMLQYLGWRTLNQGEILMYRIVNNLVEIPA